MQCNLEMKKSWQPPTSILESIPQTFPQIESDKYGNWI